MAAKTFQQFWDTWVEADTQDREGCEIVWDAATKAAEERFTSTNKPSTFALHMPPSCAGCPVVAGCVHKHDSVKCHDRLWRHVVLG